MGKPTGFMEYKRQKPEERNPLTRMSDWNEYACSFSDDVLKEQGARCMDCGTPFCHMGVEVQRATSGCPIYNLIPEWNDLVYRGRWREALDRLHKTNNFPEFTGRVCPAPCEGSCTVSINDPAVTIKSIERTIIDKGFENGWVTPRIPSMRTGKKVAIVGSGPSGLASADQLNQHGHNVTVFERADRPGGLLTYGIPNMKLDKSIVERRINLLKEEGITFVTNTEVGVDISAAELKEQFDAVILCIGARKPRDINFEGRKSKGIYFAMDFLTTATKSLLDSHFEDNKFINTKGKDVIIIGGGDTGADCVATAVRQQCRSVVQLEIMPKPPAERGSNNMWPAYPNVYRLSYAHEEAKAKFGADPREYLIQTKKVIADQIGIVKELHTIQVRQKFSDDGRMIFEEVSGTEKVWPAQCIFIAVGFEGPEQSIVDQFGVKTVQAKIDAAYGDFRTSVDGVFAAGDARRGQSLIVWAINEGREVASKVNQYLFSR